MIFFNWLASLLNCKKQSLCHPVKSAFFTEKVSIFYPFLEKMTAFVKRCYHSQSLQTP